jgi:hypothetical protein
MGDVDCEESMAADQKLHKDQPPEASANPRLPGNQPPDATKFKRPIQVVAQIVITVGSLAGAAIVKGSWHATLTVIAIAFLLLFLVQFFASLKSFPKKDLAPLISRFLNIIGWVAVVAIIAYASVQIVPRIIWGPPDPPPAESTLRELNKELNGLRAQYQKLQHFASQAPDVNKRAAVLVGKISDLNDEELGLGMQVFKYESLAYANGIVAGSEMIARNEFTAQDKLNSIKALLDASEKAQKLIEEVRRPQHADDKLQKLRAWLRDDDADQRLQRLTAVGLCFRSQVQKNPKDLAEARDLVNTLLPYYKAREHPEQSSELAECVKSN